MNTIATEVINTERLDLLPLRLEHAEEMATVLSDPALHTFTGGNPDTLKALRSRYRRMVAGSPDPATTWHNWVIRLRADARLTGTVQATLATKQPPRSPGWWAPPGKGAASPPKPPEDSLPGSANNPHRPSSPIFIPTTSHPPPSPRLAGSHPPANGTTERFAGTEPDRDVRQRQYPHDVDRAMLEL